MTKSTYEFQLVSTRQKVNLILCKLALILVILSCLGILIHDTEFNPQNDLMFSSGIMQAIFAYINLMTVKVEVSELFEPPIQWKGYEFFWIGIVMFVASYFV